MKSFLEKLYFVLVFGELTTAIPRLFGEGETSKAAGRESNPALLFFNLVVVGATFYYVFPHLPRLWRALLQLKWLFLLYLWAVLSVAWSVDRETTIRLGAYAVVYLFSAAYFAFRYDMDELFDLLGRCFLGIAILSVAGEFLLPPLEDLAPGWSGIFSQKNLLGVCMMLGIAVLLVEGKRWNLARAATLAFYLTLLGLSQSFTAIVATAALVLFVFSKRLVGWARAVLCILLGGAACLSMVISDPVELFLDAGGKSSNLTGRDVIWAFALNATVERPFLGHGYGGAFWAESSEAATQALHWNPHHAHNGYLEITLELGIVGLILLIGLLINSWKRSRRLQKFGVADTALWMQVLILAAVAHNLTETDFLATSLFWYLLVMACMFCLVREREARLTGFASEAVVTEDAELVSA